MTWRIEPSGDDTFVVGAGTGPVSRAEFFTALADDRVLRTALTATLLASPYAAFAWETPALSAATADRAAAFAIIDSPTLARVAPDPAPSPRAAAAATHLAAFVRTAPADVVDDLWSAVGRAGATRRAAKRDPVWVSTAGLGVYWLHVRLDDRPKYYRHRAFTDRSI